MKKTNLLLLSVLALGATLLVASTASAEGSIPKKFRGGFGAGLDTGGLMAINALPVGKIHIPLFINQQFRLEPTLGFQRNSTTDTPDPNNTSNTTTTTGQTLSAGIGGFYVWSRSKKNKNTALYGGLRAGLIANTNTVETNTGGTTTTVESSRNDIYVTPTIGGEYFFSKTLSFGAEAGFMYTITGDTTVSAEGGGQSSETTTSADSSQMSLHSQMIVRWYVF